VGAEVADCLEAEAGVACVEVSVMLWYGGWKDIPPVTSMTFPSKEPMSLGGLNLMLAPACLIQSLTSGGPML